MLYFPSAFEYISLTHTILLFLLYTPVLILDLTKKYTYRIDYVKLFSEKKYFSTSVSVFNFDWIDNIPKLQKLWKF